MRNDVGGAPMDARMRMVGNSSQLLKARRITFRDGVADGVRAIELQNQSGLYVTCIEEQCLNIFDFSYKGLNCAFQTKNGLISNRFFNGGANEFNYYWPGGMLYTCGLTNTGIGVLENNIYHAEHGRIGMRPAENVNITENNEGVVITGTVKDSILCGHQLELQRTIHFPMEGKEIQIYDQVTNKEGLEAEMMLLYHCNFGYPLLAPGARVVKGTGKVIDNIAGGPIPDDYLQIPEPRDDKIEEVYCHTNTPDADGFGYAAVINDELGLGCYLKYSLDTLPLLIHWKNMCSGDYVIGLEPSNTYIKGRKEERENGTLPVLKPYETQVFQVFIGVLDGAEEICEFEKKLT